MDKFQKASTTLEYNKILNMLSALATTEGSKEACRALIPTCDADKITLLQRETTDARALLLEKGEPSFGQIKDVIPLLERADKGSVLSPRELLDCANVLLTTRGIIDYSKTDRKFETVLDEVFARLISNRQLEDKITRSIISEELIADEASAALSDIRRKIKAANNKIRESLQKYVAGGAYSKYLQENIITLRNGRYVIPVKSEYRNEIKGLIHDTSSSGATLFIEPMGAVDANNELRVLAKAEETEIERILAELSARVADYSEVIRLDYYNLNYLAAVYARAKLSVKMRAEEPEFAKKRELALKGARHPLLDPAKVVPVDIRLGGEFDTLVITGPNTGGKTVTEKTLGLLVMMAQSGLHIPAASGSRLCVFDGILADIGDEQSIEQSLSTFSAHMVNIVSMLGEITPDTLAIFDELGAGTDPVEGAALAVSILEAVREKGSLCVATTHYAELKAYAIETEGVCNASCEFDIETLKPTYRLIIGAPGRSNAFAIAAKLGLDETIIERAKQSVRADNKRFENVIAQLDAERVAMQREKDEARRLRQEFETYKTDAEIEITASRRNAEAELQKAKEASAKLTASARSSSEFIFAELGKVQKQRDKAALGAQLDASKTAVRGALNEYADTDTESVDDGYVLPRPLALGETVYLKSFKKTGTVRSLPDKNGDVGVLMGTVAMKVGVSDIRIGDEYIKRGAKKKTAAVNTGAYAPRTIKSDIDLRGMNGEEAWRLVDIYLDEAKLCNLQQVTLIHGKGTGKLRDILREYLRADRRVKSFREGAYGEGDTGVTVVELK